MRPIHEIERDLRRLPIELIVIAFVMAFVLTAFAASVGGVQ